MTQYDQIPNNTQYEDQFLVANLELIKHASKCFLLNKSTFERKASQLQPSCQSPHAIELLSTQRAPQKEGSIQKQITAQKQML